LTLELRYQIYALHKAGFTQSAIANEISVDKSTISREMRRNRGLRGYRPQQAQAMAEQRRQRAANAKRISQQTWTTVESKLREDWSPEQVAGHLKRVGQATVRACLKS
jgi:IS30 family transposase